LAAFGLAGCSSDDDSSNDNDPTKKVTIGHQAFGESEILAHIYGDALAPAGYEVSYQSFGDRAAIYAAIEAGEVQLVPEYAATALEFLNGNAGEASPDIISTAAKLETALAEKDLAAAEASAAVDSNSLVVTGQKASDESLKKISDLSADMKLGGPQDCPTNAGCIPALKETYDLDFSGNFTPLDLGGPLTKQALEKGDIDVAVLFSTDSSIAKNKWVVLEDDKGIFNADNVIPVGTADFVEANAEVLDSVSEKLSTANLTEMNREFDVDKKDAAEIAEAFVQDNGLD
jgi:osmoprotectant transport system substrate-binding protein